MAERTPEKVELRANQREVHFLAPMRDRKCHFSIEHQGVLLALANIEESDSVVPKKES